MYYHLPRSWSRLLQSLKTWGRNLRPPPRPSDSLLSGTLSSWAGAAQPFLPRLRANHLAESSRHGVLPKTHSYSVLCLVTTCSPSFLIISGRTGNAEYFRVRISDMKVFADQSRIITLALCRLIINPCCQDSTGSQKRSSPTHLLQCKAVLWHLLWLWFSWTHRLYWPESVVPAAFSFHHA